MSSATRGIARERKVRALMEADGYWTARAAGSLGDADIIAVKARPGGGSTVVLVEVKTDVAGPFAHFRPADREELISAAVRSGATPVLCWWPARKQPQWIKVHDWPAAGSGARREAGHMTPADRIAAGVIPPPTTSGEHIALDRPCPRCGAQSGKRCVDRKGRPAGITHIARGWLDRRCPTCKAWMGTCCETPSGRAARGPHAARWQRPSTSSSTPQAPEGET